VDVTTAVSPGDYDAGSASVPFAPGETTHTFDVMVHGDATYESDETFDVLLSNVIGAAVSVDTGRGTIRNDDVAPVIDVGDVTVTEGDVGDTIASFVVTLTGATDVPASVDASTIDGTAGSPLDFDVLAATVTILPGATSATIDVVVHGDTMFEPDEAFGLDLTNPVDGTIGDGSGSGTILNDDPVPAIAVDDVAMPEGDAGTSERSRSRSLSATRARSRSPSTWPRRTSPPSLPTTTRRRRRP
jgi:chitinase